MDTPTADVPVRVLVVEDHRVMRDAIAESIERASGFSVVATAASGHEALEVLSSTTVDLVLIDLSLPDMSGVQLIVEISRRASPARCLVLSGHREPHYAAEARDVGALGYVVKGRPKEVITALRAVAAGDEYFSAGLTLHRSDADRRPSS